MPTFNQYTTINLNVFQCAIHNTQHCGHSSMRTFIWQQQTISVVSADDAPT